MISFYTEKMKAEGLKPAIGQIFVVDFNVSDCIYDRFTGEEVEVLSIVRHHNNDIYTFRHAKFGYAALVLKDENFKPVEISSAIETIVISCKDRVSLIESLVKFFNDCKS